MRERIQVYTDPETKRRIELAAAKRDVPVTEYCLDAIREQLAEDDLLDEEQIEISIAREPESTLIEDVQRLHQRILAEWNGTPVDVSSILEQVRAERDDELTSLY